MKGLYLLNCFILIFVPLNILFAQPCGTSGVTITATNQMEVNSLLATGCIHYAGNITIQENASPPGQEIVDLSPLGNLTKIDGWLRIEDNQSLSGIIDFLNLEYVGGEIKIEDNNNITSIQGFTALDSTGGRLRIRRNLALTSIAAFPELATISGNLEINQNDDLTNVDGFPNLSKLGGDLAIFNNDKITTLFPIPLLTYASDVSISSNDMLLNINGIEALDSVGDMTMYGNSLLNDLSGISGIVKAEELSIYEMDILESLDDLTSLEHVGYLNIGDNPILANLDGLSSLTYIKYLNLYNLPMLEDVDVFSSFTKMDGIDLSDFDNSFNMEGFNNLDSLFEELFISDNPGFTSIDAFTNLTYIGNDLSIESNTALTSIDGFSLLSQVENLSIENNGLLSDCCGVFPLLFHGEVLNNQNINSNSVGCDEDYEIFESCGRYSVALIPGTYGEDVDLYHKLQIAIDSADIGDTIRLHTNSLEKEDLTLPDGHVLLIYLEDSLKVAPGFSFTNNGSIGCAGGIEMQDGGSFINGTTGGFFGSGSILGNFINMGIIKIGGIVGIEPDIED